MCSIECFHLRQAGNTYTARVDFVQQNKIRIKVKLSVDEVIDLTCVLWVCCCSVKAEVGWVWCRSRPVSLKHSLQPANLANMTQRSAATPHTTSHASSSSSSALYHWAVSEEWALCLTSDTCEHFTYCRDASLTTTSSTHLTLDSLHTSQMTSL